VQSKVSSIYDHLKLFWLIVETFKLTAEFFHSLVTIKQHAQNIFLYSEVCNPSNYLVKHFHLSVDVFMISGCGHELCVKCALYLCSTCNIPSELVGPPGSIPCPLCRYGIVSFIKLPGSLAKENKIHISLGLCTPCMLHPRDAEHQSPARTPEIRKNRVASVSSDLFCPVTCSPFPSVAMPLCTCNDGPCPSFEPREVETQNESPQRSQSTSMEHEKMEGPRLERTSCSSMFWGRRSCSREHQCNSEINA
jgi:E3 ubiquitin-protein ligase XBAT32/33